MRWDIFISHASEDKDEVARPLTELLKQKAMKVWLDENELSLGDSLSRKIDEGLAQSRYGVVILSKFFFAKSWPPHELAGLVARQLGKEREKVILPVWHGVNRDFILQYSPTLADAVAVSTDEGLEAVAAAILRAVEFGQFPGRNRRTLSEGWWWTRSFFTVILAILGLIWGLGTLYRPEFDELRKTVTLVGTYAPPVAVAIALFNSIGMIANGALLLVIGFSIRNRQRGRQILRAVSWTMFVAVPILIVTAAASASDSFVVKSLLPAYQEYLV